MLRRLFLLLCTFCSLLSPLVGQIDADRVLKIGRNALYFEDYVVAIGYLNQVVSVRPWLAEPYFYRSVAKLSLDDYSGAATDASLAIDRNAFLPKAYLVRGIAHQNTKLWDEAEADYRKVLSLTPNDQGAGLNLVQLLVYRKRYAEADSAVRRLLTFYPKSVPGRMLLAETLIGRKDTVAGVAELDALLRADSSFAPAYARQAMLAYERQDFTRAAERLDCAIANDPDELSFYVNRGLVRYRRDDLRGAMADYTHVIDIEPTNRVARFNRALLNAYVGNSNRAIEDFDVVLRLDADNDHARYNRALLLAATGKYRRALADYDKVLTKHPRFVVGYYARSEVRRSLGDLRGADRDYWHAYDLDRELLRSGNKSAKVAPSTKDTATRDETDKRIERYRLLVVAEPSEAPKARYQSRIRGRVQDHDVAIEPRPLYTVTYFAPISDKLPASVAFAEEVESLNRRKILPHRLLLTNGDVALSVDQMHSLEQYISDLERGNKLPAGMTKADMQTAIGIDRLILLDFEEARRCFGRAIELRPDWGMNYFLRALASAKQMEADRADGVVSQERPSTAQSSTPEASHPRGIGLPVRPIVADQDLSIQAARTARYREALADLNRAIELAPTFAFAYYNRALLYSTVGETRLALADYDRAIELAPRLADAYYNRGLLKLSLGSEQEAIADLSRSGELGLYAAYNIIKRTNKISREGNPNE